MSKGTAHSVSAHGTTTIRLVPSVAGAPGLGNLKVRISLFKETPNRGASSSTAPWNFTLDQILGAQPIGQLEATADAQGTVKFYQPLSAATWFNVDRIWDDSQAPVITYFSSVWPRRPEDGPIPWQKLPLNQQYTIPFANKRIVVDRIATTLGVIRRKQWGAKQPDYPTMVGDWDYTDLVLHHSGDSGETDPKEIESEHMKKWEDVGYHYLVPPNGAIYEGRHLAFKGSHVELQNTHKIGILVMGDFEPEWWDDDDDVSSEQQSAVKRIIFTLKKEFPTIVTLGGHRDYKATDCPGDDLYALLGGFRTETGLSPPAKKK